MVSSPSTVDSASPSCRRTRFALCHLQHGLAATVVIVLPLSMVRSSNSDSFVSLHPARAPGSDSSQSDWPHCPPPSGFLGATFGTFGSAPLLVPRMNSHRPATPNQALQRIVAMFPPRPAFGSRLRVTAPASTAAFVAVFPPRPAACASGGLRKRVRVGGPPTMQVPRRSGDCPRGRALSKRRRPISQVAWHHGQQSLSLRSLGESSRLL